MIEIKLYLMKLGIVSWVLSNSTRFQLFAHLWTIVCQVSLSMGFSRQDYWNCLPWPPPGDLSNPGIHLRLLHLLHWQASTLPLVPIPEKGLFSWIVLSGYNDFWSVLCCEVLSPQIRSEKLLNCIHKGFGKNIMSLTVHTHTHTSEGIPPV